MLPRQDQTETDTLTSTSVRQRQLLDHLQQQRVLLQQRQQQLYNLLPPISQSKPHQKPEGTAPNPVKLPQYLGEESNPSRQTSSPTLALPLRTENLHEDMQGSQKPQYDQERRQFEREEDDLMAYDRVEKSSNGASGSTLPPPKAMEDDMPSTSDFVKKLYRMLEDPSFQSVVCWGPMGDCFIVKDMTECTKSVLPRMFKHSNFASFVRQLNKYDFHKVKSPEDNPYGEHSWIFRHPDFRADRPEALENIKRKLPVQRKSAPAPAPTTLNHSTSYSSSVDKEPSHHRELSSASREQLKSDARPLKVGGEDLRERIAILERNYEHVLEEMVGFQQGMAQQDGLMHSLIAYFLKNESARLKASTDASGPTSYSDLNPHLQSLLSYSSLSSLAPMGGISSIPSSQIYSSTPSPDIGFGKGSTLNSIKRPEPVSSTSRQYLKQQIQVRLRDQQNSLSFSESQLHSSSLAAAEARNQPQPRASGSLYSEPQLSDSQSQSRYLNNPESSSSSLLDQYNSSNNDGMANRYTFPQSESNSSPTRGSLSSRQHQQQQQSPLSYGVSPTDSMNQMDPYVGRDMNDRFSHRPSAQSQQVREGSVQSQQSASPNNTWDKTWEAMMAAPFNLASLPGFSVEAETELNDEGPQVCTVGHLLPRSGNNTASATSPQSSTEESAQRNWNFDNNRLLTGTSVGGNGDRSSPMFDNGVENSSEETVQPTISNSMDSASKFRSPSPKGVVTSAERQKLRVRRSTFVPGWAVPPHVLLVDDDAVSRRLSSKFLEVFGCTTDVAVDGISAVNKMNLEKYDLVLMDIVMPKLDGISATNLIRKFDKGTPIISMTGNSNPNQIMTYFSSGMNDILAKPFTKKGLLDMLEKHLVHLKVIQHMSQLPRSVGLPPLSDSNFEQALAASAKNLFVLQQQQKQQQQQQQQQPGGSQSGVLTPSFAPPSPISNNPDGTVSAPTPFNFQVFDDPSDDPQINPLAGMGISDDHYKLLLQNIVRGDRFPGIMQTMGNNPSAAWSSDSTMMWSSGLAEKRPLDNPEDEREEKRSRFEVIQ